MKKIIGLRDAQRAYTEAVKNNAAINFYFNPQSGQLICDGCDTIVTAGLRISYHNARGFRLLDVNNLQRLYGQYGIRALFAQIKKYISQKWPEYAKCAAKANATIKKVNEKRKNEHPRRSFWDDFK